MDPAFTYSGLQTAQSHSQQASMGAAVQAPAQETIVARMALAAEVLLSHAEGVEKRLHAMRARLVGAVPEPGQTTQAAPGGSTYSGIVGTIDQRLTQAYQALARAHELINNLEKIA